MVKLSSPWSTIHKSLHFSPIDYAILKLIWTWHVFLNPIFSPPHLIKNLIKNQVKYTSANCINHWQDIFRYIIYRYELLYTPIITVWIFASCIIGHGLLPSNHPPTAPKPREVMYLIFVGTNCAVTMYFWHSCHSIVQLSDSFQQSHCKKVL